MTIEINPKRGEIWLIDFEPQVAEEIKKKRPAVILSIKSLKNLPMRIVVPIRDYKGHHDDLFYMLTIEPNKKNSLVKKSTIDCSQLKAFSIKRFIKKIGEVSEKELEVISDTSSYCIGK